MTTDRVEEIGKSIPKIARGMVWCHTCGNKQRVHGPAILSGRQPGGWPRCCGQTMSIDSPAERHVLKGADT